MPGRRTPYNHALSVNTIAPQSFGTSGAVSTGTSVDRRRRGTTAKRLQHFRSALLVVHAGALGTTTANHAVKLQHSDDDVAWADVPADELQGSNPSFGGADDNKTFDQGYVGHKRYLRAVLTVGTLDLAQTALIGVSILLADVDHPPVDR